MEMLLIVLLLAAIIIWILCANRFRPILIIPQTRLRVIRGQKYCTVGGREAVITSTGPHGIQGYIVSAGFTNPPRTPCQWDNRGYSNRGRETDLIVMDE